MTQYLLGLFQRQFCLIICFITISIISCVPALSNSFEDSHGSGSELFKDTANQHVINSSGNIFSIAESIQTSSSEAIHPETTYNYNFHWKLIPVFWSFFGILFSLIVYNISYFLSVREKANLYLSGFIGCVLIVMLVHGRSGIKVIFPESHLLSVSIIPLLVITGTGFLLLFTRDFIKTPCTIPKTDLIIKALILLSIPLSITSLFYNSEISAYFCIIFSVASGFVMAVSAIISLLNKVDRSGLYFISLINLYAGALLFKLISYGFIKHRDLSFIIYQSTIVTMMLALTIGNNRRVKKIKDNHTRAVEALKVSDLKYNKLNRELIDTHGLLIDSNKKLNQEKSLLSKTLKSIGEAVITTDFNGRIVLMNLVAEKMTGFNLAKLEGCMLSEAFTLLNPQTGSVVDTEKKSFLSSFTHGTFVQYTLINSKGSEIDTEISCNKLSNLNNLSDGHIVFIRDITEKKKADNAIKQSEEKYRTIFENSGTAILIMEEDTSIPLVNSEFEHLSGYTRNEVEGKLSWQTLVHKEDLPTMLEYSRKRRVDPESVPGNYEFRIFNKMGEQKELFMTIAMIPGSTRSIASIADITRLKKTERELAESKRLVKKFSKQTELFSLEAASLFQIDSEQELIDKVCQAVVRISDFRSAVVTYFRPSPESGHISGYAGISNIDANTYNSGIKSLNDFSGYFSAGQSRGLLSTSLSVGNNTTTAKPYFEESNQITPPWFDRGSILVRMNDEKGNPIGVINLFGNKNEKLPTDETVRPLEIFSTLVSQIILYRKSQEAARNLQQELFHVQKIESIGTLASGIAHDFNNLLTGILGNVNLIQLRTDKSSRNWQKLQRITELVESGADLTRQILGFARGGKYEIKPVNINQILKNSLEMFARTKREIKVVEKLHDKLWAIEADKSQIEQVLINLYVNASHAMGGGGVLTIETGNIKVDKQKSRSMKIKTGNHIWISVADTGTGMDEETRQRIFEPFFTTKEMGRGTGLGLASAYGIIKNHDGTIKCTSKKGEGTTFEIFLPASSKKAVEKRKTITNGKRGEETVLIVDDEKVVRETAMELLTNYGYNILIADGGNEAVSVFNKNKDNIDIVVLDMVMPDMGGSETFDKIREIKTDAKILLASGYTLSGQASEILDRGCNGFIQKPFIVEELSHKIREIIDYQEADYPVPEITV